MNLRISKRIAAVTLAAATVVGGGVVAASPASAIGPVQCPGGGAKAYGIELWMSGWQLCYAGSVGAIYPNVDGVNLVTSQWNNGIITANGSNYNLYAGGSLSFTSAHVSEVQIV
ncbi:hypothetical protein ACWDD9_21280 [Kitasatospora sp. NPDC001119]|uniref:hypothetical protein n=1 Tax=Kitasatospora TaxID=2063 RepID=UPI0011C3452B|nr:hypothetical protein [Kitasatospora xanthocidica]